MILKTYLLILIFSIGHLLSYIPRELHQSPSLKEIARDTNYVLKFIRTGEYLNPPCNQKDTQKTQVAAVGAATVGFCHDLLRKILTSPSIDDLLRDSFEKEIRNFGSEVDQNEIDKLLNIAKIEAKKRGIELDEKLVKAILTNALNNARKNGIEVDIKALNKLTSIPQNNSLTLTKRAPSSKSRDALSFHNSKASKALPETLKNKNFDQVIKSFGAKDQDEASALFDLATLANNRNIPNKHEGYAALAPIGKESLRVYLEVKKELDSKAYPKETKEFIAEVVLKRTGHQSDKLKITRENLLHIANVHRATRNIPIRGSPKPVRFHIGENPKKVAIIGRKMEGLVNETRDHLKTQGNEVKIFSPSRIANTDFKERAKAVGSWLSHEQVLETLTYKENKSWAENLLEEGYLIIDMGNPMDLGKSTFYEMEKKIIFNDKLTK